MKTPIQPRAQALKLLARREHSARELKRKLAARGIGADEAAAAVADVAAEGSQSDARFASMLVRTRIGKGFGPVRIEAELRQAGVSAEDICSALDQAGADWRDLCVQAQARHFGSLPKSSAERAKQYRYLQGRGFESSQISSTLRGVAEEE